jgi:glycosyltransferase involved in cell wall biosynthesis
MARYVPEHLFARAVLDTHNSELRRVETMARTLGWTMQGMAARLQRAPVARFEREVAARMARLAAVSEEERAYFEQLAPGRVDLVPNGVDCRALRPRSTVPASRRMLFLGSLDYSANVEAVGYLVDRVLPLLAHRHATVDVVGSNPRAAVFDAARRSVVPVQVAGYVPDADPFWNEARALVVPLRIGGGTRLKILEALARGVPVVSTSLGCEGLGLRDGEDLLVADDSAGFAAAMARLLDDDDLCRRLAATGRATVEERFDWSVVGQEFERCLIRAVGTG